MGKGDYEYEEVVLMHTSLEVHLFEQLHLLTEEVALRVEGLAACASQLRCQAEGAAWHAAGNPWADVQGHPG